MTLRELAELMPPRRRDENEGIKIAIYASVAIALIVGLCAYLKP